jgi:hypothetical protein
MVRTHFLGNGSYCAGDLLGQYRGTVGSSGLLQLAICAVARSAASRHDDQCRHSLRDTADGTTRNSLHRPFGDLRGRLGQPDSAARNRPYSRDRASRNFRQRRAVRSSGYLLPASRRSTSGRFDPNHHNARTLSICRRIFANCRSGRTSRSRECRPAHSHACDLLSVLLRGIRTQTLRRPCCPAGKIRKYSCRRDVNSFRTQIDFRLLLQTT